MKSIKTLNTEHQNILRMLEVIKKMAIAAIEKNIEIDHFKTVTEFISNYADGYHHDKEEKILFEYMISHCGPAAITLVRNGMFVEHDLARYYNRSLKGAIASYEKTPSTNALLEILTYILSYSDLLKRHIDKEDSTVFPFAEKTLPEEIKKENEEKFEKYHSENSKIEEKYLELLKELEDIYL